MSSPLRKKGWREGAKESEEGGKTVGGREIEVGWEGECKGGRLRWRETGRTSRRERNRKGGWEGEKQGMKMRRRQRRKEEKEERKVRGRERGKEDERGEKEKNGGREREEEGRTFFFFIDIDTDWNFYGESWKVLCFRTVVFRFFIFTIKFME